MVAVTLLLKAYGKPQLKIVDGLFASMLGGLKVKLEPCRIGSRGWVQTGVSGEDETIALNLLAREVGLCPVGLDAVEKFATLKGYVTAFDKNKGLVNVDVGFLSSEAVEAKVPLRDLQAQLADGRKVALDKFVKLFGLSKNQTLLVKVISVETREGGFEASLAESQVSQYRLWASSLLDRLVVLRASRDAVEQALKRAECLRDVVDVESLGLFEHAVVCKLGTDAVGLIPKLGRCLPYAVFSVFSPRRLLEFFGEDSNLFVLS